MAETRTVLVVIDPTVNEQPALARAEQLARKLNASLELFVCVYDQYLTGRRFGNGSLEKARQSLIDNHLQRLRRIADTIGEGLSVRADATWDHPLHEGIVRKILRSKPAWVVKDTHYHSVLRRSIFSNTDWELIRTCPVPLYLAKSRPWREPLSVIACVDPTHAGDKPARLDQDILATATQLANQFNGTLHAFHAFSVMPIYAAAIEPAAFPIAVRDEFAAAARTELEQSMRELMANFPDVARENIHMVEGDTRNTLCALAEKLDAAIVVMGAVSRHGFDRILLGSTAENVLDHIPCDLVVVKPSGFEAPSTKGE